MAAGALTADHGETPSLLADLRPLRAGLTVVGLATLATLFGGASVVELGLPVAAVLAGLALLMRARHLAYIHLVLALWAFAPGVRRLVDWQTSYHESSPVLLAAPLATCVGVFFCSPKRARLPTTVVAFVSVFGIVLIYALLAGSAVSGLSRSAVSFALWFPPFLFGLYVALGPFSQRSLARQLAGSSWLYLFILGGYGVAQWVLAPAWDTTWMDAIFSPSFSFGTTDPFGIRVFSLLNAPYPLGCALVVLILTQLACPLTSARVVSLVVGLAALGLSSVRAAWLVLALAVVLLAVRGRIPGRIILVTGLLAALVVGVAPKEFTDTIGDRFDTFDSGTSDVSFSARSDFYSTIVPRLLADPTGSGFGSTGAGVRAGGQSADATFSNVDSSYIDVLQTFGPVFGIPLLLLFFASVIWLWRRLGRRNGAWSVWSALLLTTPVLAILGDVFGGINGIFLWLGLALSARESVVDAPAGGPTEADAVTPAPSSR